MKVNFFSYVYMLRKGSIIFIMILVGFYGVVRFQSHANEGFETNEAIPKCSEVSTEVLKGDIGRLASGLYRLDKFIGANKARQNISVSDADSTAMQEMQKLVHDFIPKLECVVDTYDSDITLLEEQIKSVGELEKSTHARIRKEIDNLEDKEISKKRLIENNMYFAQKYKAMTYVMQMLVVFVVVFFILQFLMNLGWLSRELGNFVMPIYLASAIAYLIHLYIDILRRNPLNYNEYQWTFNQSEKNE